MKLIEICNEIAKICRVYGADEWSHLFDSFIDKIEVNGIESSKKEMKKIYSGMGSFSDLILQQDGQVYTEANNRLEFLRESLYKMVME